MINLITYKNGQKLAKVLTSRKEYLMLRNSDEQQRNVSIARGGDPESAEVKQAKCRLIQMNYSAAPAEEALQNAAAEEVTFPLKGCKTPSNSVGMDIDHLAPEQMETVGKTILEKSCELGLLMLEKSARGTGYHVVFKRRKGLSQEENLQWASDLIGVPFDGGAKDITRVFFTTTASDEDLLYLSDVLFDTTPFDTTPFDTASSETNEAEETPAEPGASEDFADDYDGIPYAFIVEELETQLGGVPVHGSRNQFIFSMACNLRYICNNDAKWIRHILPNYGEDVKKWMSTIGSACKRAQNQKMPVVMERAIALAREKVLAEDEQGDADKMPEMPKKLPPLMKLLTSRTPKLYKPAVAFSAFPALASHLYKTSFKYTDNVEHEMALMSVMMGGTSSGKGCLNQPLYYIMKDIRERDEVVQDLRRRWKAENQVKGANKDRSMRPEGVVQILEPDSYNAGLVQALLDADGHPLYSQMNEIDALDGLRGSTKDGQFHIIKLAFDTDMYGQTRVGMNSVDGHARLRFNWNASTTVNKGISYFRSVVTDGTINRLSFCYIPDQEIGADQPKYGDYTTDFEEELKPYIDRLCAARGLLKCAKIDRFIEKLIKESAERARLTQSRTFEVFSFRANLIAAMKAYLLFVAHGMIWDKTMEDFIRWSRDADMWCKMRFFGEAFAKESGYNAGTQKRSRGPQNLLDKLPNRFAFTEAVNIRRLAMLNASSKETLHMLSQWKSRGYIAEEILAEEASAEGQESRSRTLQNSIWLKTDFYLEKIEKNRVFG